MLVHLLPLRLSSKPVLTPKGLMYYQILLLTLFRFKMFEARIVQGSLLKKIIESIRELVNDVNIECSETGISLQVAFSTVTMLLAIILMTFYQSRLWTPHTSR